MASTKWQPFCLWHSDMAASMIHVWVSGPGGGCIQWPRSSCGIHQSQGWGLQSQFPPFRYYPNFSASPKYMLAIVYHVHIWQVLPQLSCGDTCQIWMWCKQSNRYFDRIETFAYGEINERSFSNPHPRYCWCGVPCIQCLYQSSSLYTRHACNNIPLECSNISLKWERT